MRLSCSGAERLAQRATQCFGAMLDARDGHLKLVDPRVQLQALRPLASAARVHESVAQTDHWSIANTNSSNLSSVLTLLQSKTQQSAKC